MRRLASILLPVAALAFFAPAGAQTMSAPAPAPSATATPIPLPTTKDSVTHHAIMLDGKRIAYTAHAGTIILRNTAGDPTASMFYVAYTADGMSAKKRPVTFLWNGGPGGSTEPLHIASLGPVRIAFPSDGSQPRPDTPLIANRYSLLDTSDLVFIDAVGTGWSRIVGRGKPSDFFGIDEDARTFTQFIERWITREARWDSPKFLLGESYGTTRAANVAGKLLDDGVSVNGVILQSSALDYNMLPVGQGPGEDYAYISYLPTEAAVAWYHHKLPGGAQPNLDHFIAEVRAFAGGPYASALFQGDLLDPATRHQIVEKLHAYTGLSTEYIEAADLRIQPGRFGHALLLNEEQNVGRYDGRYTGGDLDPNGSFADWDPSATNILSTMNGRFHAYANEELAYHEDRPYEVLSFEVNREWKYQRGDDSSAPAVVADLKSAMTQNPYLHVLSASGYFDLATGFYGTEYLLNHMHLPAKLRGNVEFSYYPSGHMIYLNEAALAQYKRDLVRFYANALRH
jgi:carboxypeptidase C (cathepsin A)